jgi:acetylornithine/N-succinyldiaminopimelate aminotransferase
MTPDLQHPFMSVFQRPPVVMARGEGSYLWDTQGRRYLDLIQGWAVNALGHTAPEVVEAVARQASTLITSSPALHNEPAHRLASRLVELTGLAALCFTNSGAEAIEVAIKVARKWGRLHRAGAFEIVSAQGAFHGRTLAAMAASGKPGWDAMFPPYPPGFVRVPFGDATAVRAAIGPRTAAILIEPIQGEAGVLLPPPGYLAELRAIADETGVLLMLDEVQTGIGRTGRLFAHQSEGVLPDVLTLGKGLGGGLPVAAVVVSRRADCLAVGEMGGTYHGNPLVCAAALAVLDVVARPGFLAAVRDRGEELGAALGRVAERWGDATPRGRGLLWALELQTADAERRRDAAFARGLIVNAAQANVLRLMPSLRLTASELAEAEAILLECGARELPRRIAAAS